MTHSHYVNPILPGFQPDPSICRAGDDYYLVTSSFEYFPGVPIFHSRDLAHWRPIGHVLTRPSQLRLAGLKSSEGVFAPTIRYHAGTFYMITTVVPSSRAFVVRAQDPAGPWSEPLWIDDPDAPMDPSLLFDASGKVYYTRHGGGRHGAIYQAELDLETGRFTSELRKIWDGTGDIWPEGPHLYAIGEFYYLFIAEGGTSYQHMVTVARSESPWGPFVPAPANPILTHRHLPDHPIQALGHADLVRAPNGSWWLVCLGVRPQKRERHHLGRETFLAPVTWSHDGWPIVNAGRPLELSMDATALPAPAPWPEEAPRDDFDARTLSPRWNFLREPDETRWTLTERPGFLRLRGAATTLEQVGTPAFVGRRQQHAACTFSARLEFLPREEGQEAGLVLRANEDYHYTLSIVRAGGQRRVQLRARVAGVTTLIAEASAEADAFLLVIEASPERYRFSFAVDGQELCPLGDLATEPLSTEIASGFTGVCAGMYAVNPSAGDRTPADFDWFEYRAAPTAAG